MESSSLHFAHRFDQVSGSAIREIFKVIAKPGMISFAGGNPSVTALPDEKVSELAVKVLKENGKALLQYGATEGYPPFVEALHQYITETVGFQPEAVLPVTGSTQAMDLLCKALIDPGDTILVENPSFLGNLQCMRLYQANLIPVASDEQGLLPEDLEEKIRRYQPKMLYTIPTFQNPTGRTLSFERRKAIAELASRYHMIVAEDDPYRDLRYSGEKLPAIKCFDTDDWVVFLGSFSKTISPGLRVGYLSGRPDLIRKCTVGKQSSDVHTANLNQAILDRMLGHLQEISGLVRFTKPEGGLFVWAELPENMDAKALLNKAIEQKVAFVPGTHFFVDGGHENTLRLNFSNSTLEQIDQGMNILKDLILQESRR